MTNQAAAASAADKLEAFVASLSPEEQAELAPILAAGMAKAFEDAQAEVEGFSAMNMQIQPQILQFVSQSRTPTILGLGNTKFFPPMPNPM